MNNFFPINEKMMEPCIFGLHEFLLDSLEDVARLVVKLEMKS